MNNLKFVVRGFKEHFNDGWNVIDGSFLVLSAVAAGLWIQITVLHQSHVQTMSDRQLMGDVKYNENFLSVSFLMLEYSRLCSINVILIFIKVLKYLASWFERVMIIFQTLSHAKSDILYFLIMYIIIFFAFVVMCHIYYGADLTTFGTIIMSLKTLFLMLLGDLGYLDDMIVLNKVLSFFFFIAFMTSMQFILVNMFIAFISNAYSEVKDNSVTAKRLEDELK
jgi:Polycystin cation channel